MLSRLAESSFWMGRYLERSEGVTRLLLEFYHLVIQDQGLHAQRGCALLTHGLGLEGEALTGRDLVDIVTGSNNDPGTIKGSIYGARSNARSIRDTLPHDFFESINRLQVVSESFDLNSPAQSMRLILDRLAVCNGVYEWLAPSDQSTQFFVLGRALERIDLVSRLLMLNIESEWREQGCATTLRSVGALSTFQKSKASMTPKQVREFLMRDETFPRSLYESCKSAEDALVQIAISSGATSNQVLRHIGPFESQLQYLSSDPLQQIEVIRSTSRIVEETSSAIRDHFFRPIGSIVWSN